MSIAVLLMYLDEEQAFWCLAALIEDILPQDYYARSLIGSRVDQQVTSSTNCAVALCFPGVLIVCWYSSTLGIPKLLSVEAAWHAQALQECRDDPGACHVLVAAVQLYQHAPTHGGAASVGLLVLGGKHSTSPYRTGRLQNTG